MHAENSEIPVCTIFDNSNIVDNSELEPVYTIGGMSPDQLDCWFKYGTPICTEAIPEDIPEAIPEAIELDIIDEE